MEERVTEKTPDGHQAVYVGQHEYARYGGSRGENVREPLVRAELRGGRKQHGEAQNQKHRPESLSKHPTGGDAGRHALSLGYAHAQKHRAVDEGRYKDNSHLYLPAKPQRGQKVRCETTDENAARKPHVEQV